MPTTFRTWGPYPVPYQRERRGRVIKTGCPDFWERHDGDEGLRWLTGCYIFAFKTGRGFMPIYVGKATKSYAQECFAVQKIANHYGPALARQQGQPVVFLVAAERKRGRVSSKDIAELERYLIRQARFRNPKLSNIHHNKDERFVFAEEESRGRTTNAWRALGKMMQW